MLPVVQYGFVYGTRCLVPVVVGDSETFEDLSGKFVKWETSVDTEGDGQVVPAGDADTVLAGWLEVSEYTSGATAGLDRWQVDVSPLSIYRIGITGTLAIGDVGDCCDLVISGTTQTANVDEGAEGTIIIVKRESASIALVRMNPSKITGAAAAA